MISDKKIAWNRKRVFFHAHQMAGMLADSSLGVNTPTAIELTITTAEVVGLPFDDEDEVYHYWPIPWDMNIDEPIRFRVWFVHAATSADTPAFQVDYVGIAKQAAIVDAQASADESVAISAHTCSTTDNSLEVTAWAESASDLYLAATDFLLQLCLSMSDLGSATGDECEILGFELDYEVQAAPGPTRKRTRDAVASPSGPNG
jgi:hypothetical protein